MGVIHKLHPDVIEFIISSKKSDPSLGVRQLADVVQVQMGVKVSKSSISNLLKSVSLSDSVGRKKSRTKNAKTPKASSENIKDTFEIPPQKKQQISQNLESVKSLVDVSVTAPERADDVDTRPALRLMGFNPAAVTAPAPVAGKKASFDHSVLSNQDNISQKGDVAAGMGLIFLKAAQWSSTNRGIWSRVFEKSADSETSDAGTHWDNQFLLSVLEKEFGDFGKDAKRPEFLFNDGADQWSHEDRVGAHAPDQEAYEIEAQIALSRVSGVQVLLSDGRSFWFDPQMVSLQGIFPAKIGFELPLMQTINAVSVRWISHRKPIIFFAAPENNQMEPFFLLHDACEGREDFTISSIVLSDDRKDELFAANHVPEHKRIYLMGLWPWRSENSFWMADGGDSIIGNQFSRVFHKRHADKIKDCYFPQLRFKVEIKDYDVEVVDKKSGFKRMQRSILAFQGNQILWGVLTNDFESSPESVLEAYLERWPNGDQFLFKSISYYNQMTSNISKRYQMPRILSEQIPSQAAIFDHFSQILKHIAKTMFFDLESQVIVDNIDIEGILKIPGFTQISENELRVILLAESGDLPNNQLSIAAGILNQMDIWDYKDRKVRIHIDFI